MTHIKIGENMEVRIISRINRMDEETKKCTHCGDTMDYCLVDSNNLEEYDRLGFWCCWSCDNRTGIIHDRNFLRYMWFLFKRFCLGFTVLYFLAYFLSEYYV